MREQAMREQEIAEIIRKAMEAVSVGGRTYPNRLRPMTTHYAIQVAVDVVIHGKSETDRAAEDLAVLEEAARQKGDT